MLNRILTIAMVVLSFGISTAHAEVFDFGSLAVGSSASVTQGGTNSGFDPMSLSLSVSGPDAADFSVVLNCGSPIPPGGSCSGTATFHPGSPGTKTAILTVSYATIEGSGAYNIEMTGVAVGSSTNLGVFDPGSGVPATLPPVVQSVTPSGASSSLSLSTQMKFDAAIAGQQGSIFVGAHVPALATFNGVNQSQSLTEMRTPQAGSEAWYISSGSSWSQYGGGTISPIFTGVLNDASSIVSILNNVDASRYCGTEFYVGYGSNSNAMLTNNTLGKVYTVMCNFAFTGSPSGDNNGLTLSSNLQVATLDVGKQGNYYVGKLRNGGWSINNGSAWVPYSGGVVPPYASGTLATRTIRIFSSENLSGQSGAQIFVGYGLTSDDLLGNQKYGLVYTVQ